MSINMEQYIESFMIEIYSLEESKEKNGEG